MNLSEELYILYRRAKAAMSWSVYLACSIFAVRSNKIVFSAFEGGGYGCNPRYIAEELIRRMHKDGKAYEMVWLVNDVTKKFPKEITPVKNTLWNRAYHLSTAKVWVDNARKNYGTRKRKGQFYMQTWHGQIGIKPVGKLRGKSFSRIAELVTRYDAVMEDCFLINSERCYEVFSKGFYNEPLRKTGSPRCDVLLGDRKKAKLGVRKKLNLPQNARLCMYAPTFRGGSQAKTRKVFQEEFSLDFQRLRKALERRFQGDWYILLRLHPQLSLRNVRAGLAVDRCIDISQEDDMYEYLSGIDAFLSDYSSAESEAALMGIPVFVYADDLEDYMGDRGKLLNDMHEFPFPVAKNNDELENNIRSFDEATYHKAVGDFFQRSGLLEDGRASARCVDIIEEYLTDNVVL